MEGSIATGVVGEAMHHHQAAADEPQGHKIILLEGLTADATLQLLRERLAQLPQAPLDLVMYQSTAFWVYTLIILVCFYIFHRLTEVRSEENNIWAIASKERKIEAKIAEEEKEEEKQKDKLERHKLRARKQRLLQELHPSIAKMQHEEDVKRRSVELKRDSNNNNNGTSKAALNDSGDNKKKKKVAAAATKEKEKRGEGVGEGAHVTWKATDSGGSDATTTSPTSSSSSVSQKKRAKKRRRRLARKMAMADSGITELGS